MTEVKAKTVKKVEKAPVTARYIEVMGKRKTASARVRMFQGGTGKITVNDVDLKEYFPTPIAQTIVQEPLKLTALDSELDFTIKVRGGGKQGQAEAVRHGIACGLLALNIELRSILKAQGWLTRDARKKERKKPGLKKARRAPQWSKR
jgi:small subunit ribosomal protein S9